MSDLRRLQHLLNELQPQFLELQQSISPPGAPVVSLTDYGPDHVTWNLPQMDVSDNGHPTVLTVTGLPSYDFPYNQTELAPDLNPQSTEQGVVPGQWSELQTTLQQPPDHAYTLSITPITVTALDFTTGLQSNPITFTFLGFGPDPTIPAGSYPPSQKQLSEWNQLNDLVTTDPAVPTIQELLAEQQAQAVQLIDPPQAPSIRPLQDAMATWSDHQGWGSIGQQHVAWGEGNTLFGPSGHNHEHGGDHQ